MMTATTVLLHEVARDNRARTRADRLRIYQTAVERLVKQHGQFVDDQVRTTFGLLDTARREIVVELTSRVGSVGDRFTHDRLARLRGAIDAIADEIRHGFAGLLGRGLYAAWRMGETVTDDALGAINIRLGRSTPIDTTHLQVLTGLTADLIERVTDDFRHRGARAIAVGALASKPPTAIITEIAGLLATQPERTDGTLGPIASQADRIVRTELPSSFATANRLRHDQIGTTVPDLRKYWASEQDSRVRSAHAAADDRYRPGGATGPIPWDADFRVGGELAQAPHDARLSIAMKISCRCISVPYRREWFNAEGGV